MDGPIIGESSVAIIDFSDYMDGENFMDVPDENYGKVCYESYFSCSLFVIILVSNKPCAPIISNVSFVKCHRLIQK